MTPVRAFALALSLTTGSVLAALPQTARAQVFVDIRVRVAPPPLPIYEQPPLPAPDYIWTPGYWAWDDGYGGYYWVPGTWVLAPRPGYLWTPSYWGWDEGSYVFHRGYWGPHVGYYGGVNYGFGYTGFGFEGGYWNGPHYFYNRAVSNVINVNITNVYTRTVIVNRTTVNRVSYSGGPGGVIARPTPEQVAAAQESHIPATPMQARHIQAARANRALFASANHGAPPVAASVRPAQFDGPGVVRAQRPLAMLPGSPRSRGALGVPGGRGGGRPGVLTASATPHGPRPLGVGAGTARPFSADAVRAPDPDSVEGGQVLRMPGGDGRGPHTPPPLRMGEPRTAPPLRAQQPLRPTASKPVPPRPHPQGHGERTDEPHHER